MAAHQPLLQTYGAFGADGDLGRHRSHGVSRRGCGHGRGPLAGDGALAGAALRPPRRAGPPRRSRRWRTPTTAGAATRQASLVIDVDTTHSDLLLPPVIGRLAGDMRGLLSCERTRVAGQELPRAMQMLVTEEQPVVWRSRYLETEMPLRVYGHFGMPLLVFPTSGADPGEFERNGMIDGVSDLLAAGRLKILHVGSVNRQSFFNRGASAARRLERQLLYDRYIHQEVVPYIYEHCHSDTTPDRDRGVQLRGVSRGQ